MKSIFLTTLLLFSLLDFSFCQTINSININIKFVDESNNPIQNLPVSSFFSGAPISPQFVTDEKGLINVNLPRLNTFSKDTVFRGCFYVNYNDYEFLFKELEIVKDTINEDFTQVYEVRKIHPVKLDDALFNNLKGMISLSDFAFKDTIFLYQSYMFPKLESSRTMASSSIKLEKITNNIFKLDVYGSELSTNVFGREDSFVINRTEKLIRVYLKKGKIEIEIDGITFKYFLHGLEVPTRNGNTHRYMLIRI